MISNPVKFVLCIMFLILSMSIPFSYAEENGSATSKVLVSDLATDQSELSPIKELNLEVEPESWYEVRLISPELLSTIQANCGPEDEILKIGPGLVIGVSSLQTLYLRSDLQSDEFLLKNRDFTDLKEKVYEHLVDISFGRDNSNLTILKKDLKYKFWFDATYTREDIDNALRFAKLFNNLSATTQFEDEEVVLGDLKSNYEIIPYNYYNVKIVPKQFLEDYKKDKYKSSLESILKNKKNDMIGILSGGYVYLWDGLSTSDRNYYLTKSLFWSAGLHGETSTYPDSYFSPNANTSSTLSSLDQEAIKLLYGGRLNTAMTVDEVRKALGISKN
jgi:hypothetical protein